jgi:hypothetical protein
MVEGDLDSVVDIASMSFHGMRDRAKARMWIACNMSCSHRMQYFVAEDGGRILGYILWVEMGRLQGRSRSRARTDSSPPGV